MFNSTKLINERDNTVWLYRVWSKSGLAGGSDPNMFFLEGRIRILNSADDRILGIEETRKTIMLYRGTICSLTEKTPCSYRY